MKSTQEKSFEFRKAKLSDKEMIFEWLDAPHMKEFWDNSQEHRDDIANFMEGRKEKSGYFDGLFSYWIGLIGGRPFAFILTHYESDTSETPEPYRPYVSNTGKTMGLDFGIGNVQFMGKGLSYLALKAFMNFIVKYVDPDVDRFIIDPFLSNPRAIQVYKKAGFEIVSEFSQEGGFFDHQKGVVMVKDYEK